MTIKFNNNINNYILIFPTFFIKFHTIKFQYISQLKIYFNKLNQKQNLNKSKIIVFKMILLLNSIRIETKLIFVFSYDCNNEFNLYIIKNIIIKRKNKSEK